MPWRLGSGPALYRFVLAKFMLDFRLQIGIDIVVRAGASTPRSSSRSTPGACLMPHPVANALGLFQKIIEENAHIRGHAVDDGENLLEHIAHEI